MKMILEGILLLVTVVLSFIIPFFVLAFIIKSLKNKNLSKKFFKKLIISLVVLIGLNILPFLLYRSDIQSDVNGDYLAFVIFFYFIISALFNLFVLGLFYSLYYVKLNQNNNEVDNKKPLKTFGKICLVFILIIVGFCVKNFIEDNKNYIAAKFVNTEIVKVSSVYEIPNLEEYMQYNIREDDNYNSYLGKKIFASGVADIYYNDDIKGTAVLELETNYYFDNGYMHEYDGYELYFSYDKKIPEDSFVKIYGIIKEIYSDYNGAPIVVIIPEKIYYVQDGRH